MKEIATGYLRVSISNQGNPIANAYIRCYRIEKTHVVYEDFFMSDSSGNTPTIALYAPDPAYSLSPFSICKPYETYMIEIRRSNFNIVKIEGIQIFANQHSFLPIELDKNTTSNTNIPISISKIPVHLLFQNYGGSKKSTKKAYDPICKALSKQVIIPPYVCIHGLSHPKDETLYVPFLYYLKNISCSHLYPTWPIEALYANIWIILFSILHEANDFWHLDETLLFHINNTLFIQNRNLYQSICTAVEDTFQVFIQNVYNNENFYHVALHPSQKKDPWSILTAVNNGYKSNEIVSALGYPCMEVTNKQKEASLPIKPLQVHILQEQINCIAKYYKQVSAIPLTNTIDKHTKNALSDIQRLLGLSIDGILDDALYTLIVQLATECKKL